MPSLSTSQINSYISEIKSLIDTKTEEIEFFAEKIITNDAKKGETDNLIKNIDKDIFQQISVVNDKLKEVQDAYQARIDGGSRTDLFWRKVAETLPVYRQGASAGGKGGGVSYTILVSPGTITYECTRLNFNGYAGLTGVTTRPSVPTEKGYPIPRGTISASNPVNISDLNKLVIYITPEEFDKKYPVGSQERKNYFAQYPFGIGMKIHPSDYDGTGSLTTPTSSVVEVYDEETSTTTQVYPDNDEKQNHFASLYQPPDTKIGFRSDRLHAIKYFDEPRTNDLADTTLTSFTGYIGAGSTILTILSEIGSGVLYDVRPGQLVVVGSGSSLKVFSQNYAEVVGIDTVIGNLNPSNGLIQATASAEVSFGKTITSINITNPGFGYDFNPSIAIAPPSISQAISTAIVSSSGTISQLKIINPGFGYTTPPVVSITDSGSTATASAIVSIAGTIESVDITSSGYGYDIPPTVTIGFPGSQAIGIASTSNTGTISEITVTNQGIGYTSNPAPVVIIESPTSGTKATATANVNSSGILTTITLNNVGSGYTFNPQVQISSPTQGIRAFATSEITNGRVTSINIQNGGSNYQVIPTVSISKPSSKVSASATSFIDSSGRVALLQVTNGGLGYDPNNPPTVIVEPPELGRTALATARVTSGIITAIDILDSGLGYTPRTNPEITIQPPYFDNLKTLILDSPSTVSVSSTEAISFDVLISASTLAGIITDLSVPTNISPFSPQTIGIMSSSQLGIGTFIVYDNSGKSSTKKSWRPELEAPAYGEPRTPWYVPAVTKPVVGSGLIWYKKGFRYRPMKFDLVSNNISFSRPSLNPLPPTNIRPASEGDRVTITYGLENYLFQKLPENKELDDKLNEKIAEARKAISDLQNSTGVLNLLISMSNTLRQTRDEVNLDIWSNRHLIGQLQQEIEKYTKQLELIEKNQSLLMSS